MTQAEMRSYGERSVADIGTERRDKAESWRENQREREDAEKGKFGGKESETRQRSRKENMARAQEIAIWGRRNQLVTNPIQSSVPPHLPLLSRPRKVIIPARTTRCDELASRVNFLWDLGRQLQGRLEWRGYEKG